MQVSSLKYEVDTRKKTTKDLESKLVALERRHWEAAGRAEDTKKELERKHVDKVVENESLKKTVENLERKVGLKTVEAIWFDFICDRRGTVTQRLF